jgi:hypothetical protein
MPTRAEPVRAGKTRAGERRQQSIQRATVRPGEAEAGSGLVTPGTARAASEQAKGATTVIDCKGYPKH